jgi:uncharacterized protein (DUF488 family)
LTKLLSTPPLSSAAAGRRLLTVGHGTLDRHQLGLLLRSAGVELVADVRSFPGSRRHPDVNRETLSAWLAADGMGYRWWPALGGFRRPHPDSPNTALRHPSFRGYADHMESPEFQHALDALLSDAEGQVVAAMCSESLWWRCHRRLLADAVELTRAVPVLHLGHDGRLQPHRPTGGARAEGAVVRYRATPTCSLPIP